jgi:hypothetical protein
MLFSLAYAYQDTIFTTGDRYLGAWFQTNRRHRRSSYSDIPDADSTVPTFHTHLADSAELLLPMTTTTTAANLNIPAGDGGSNSPMMRAYQYNNRLSARVWKALSLSTSRVGIYLASMWPHYEDQRRARRRQGQTGPKDV